MFNPPIHPLRLGPDRAKMPAPPRSGKKGGGGGGGICYDFRDNGECRFGPDLRLTGFRQGSGQTGLSRKGHTFVLSALILPHVICCHMLMYFPMNIDYLELRHFSDDPGCPDPVWKLSTGQDTTNGG